MAKAQEEPLERVSFPQGQKPRVTVYDCVGGPDAFLDGKGRQVMATVESIRRRGEVFEHSFWCQERDMWSAVRQAVGHLEVDKNLNEKGGPWLLSMGRGKRGNDLGGTQGSSFFHERRSAPSSPHPHLHLHPVLGYVTAKVSPWGNKVWWHVMELLSVTFSRDEREREMNFGPDSIL